MNKEEGYGRQLNICTTIFQNFSQTGRIDFSQ